MKSKLTLYGAIFLIVLGVISFLNTYFNLHLWRFVWPALLILIGAWFIFSPRAAERFTFTRFIFLGDVQWQTGQDLKGDHFLAGIGDFDLDLNQALIPVGETEIKITAFIADISVRQAADVGLSLNSNAVITSAKVMGEKEDDLFYPFAYESENFTAAEKKVRFNVQSLISDVKIKA
jgi:hypothetical protein